MKNEVQKQEKTHWLQNPNKNYLGHWDLPGGKPVILTITSVKWEEVKNPIINKSDSKRVIRFKETDKWVKPMICNQINSQTIMKSTGEKYMEDSVGKRIKIAVSQTKVKGEEVDCLRIVNVPQSHLEDKIINQDQFKALEVLLEKANKNKIEFCGAMGIDSVAELPAVKLVGVMKRLNEIINNKGVKDGA